MVIQIVIIDAEVLVAPKKWLTDKKIKRYYTKHQRMPLINGSDHQHLIKQYPQKWRHSRPDILHFALLLALNLAKNSELATEILFSINSQIYKIDSLTKIPRAQNRFYAILEILLQIDRENPFIKKVDETWETLLVKRRIGFSRSGSDFISKLPQDNTAFIYGGNAHGTVNFDAIKDIHLYKIIDQSLELWSAIALTLPQALYYS